MRWQAELQASLAREEALREEKRDLSQRQVILAQEFEHRVANGLQLIASLLVIAKPDHDDAGSVYSTEHRRPSH